MSKLIEQTLTKRISRTINGEIREFSGVINLAEAQILQHLVSAHGLNVCVETGVAHGISTLAICEALSKHASDPSRARLYGIDPAQYTEHGGAAMQRLADEGLEKIFTLMEGPTHLMAPRLLDTRSKG